MPILQTVLQGLRRRLWVSFSLVTVDTQLVNSKCLWGLVTVLHFTFFLLVTFSSHVQIDILFKTYWPTCQLCISFGGFLGLIHNNTNNQPHDRKSNGSCDWRLEVFNYHECTNYLRPSVQLVTMISLSDCDYKQRGSRFDWHNNEDRGALIEN